MGLSTYYKNLLHSQLNKQYGAGGAPLRNVSSNEPLGTTSDAEQPPFLASKSNANDAYVGRDELLAKLWQYITQGKSLCLFIPPGAGQTTAVELVNDNKRILQHFDGFLSANLGRQFDIAEVLWKWVSILGVPDNDQIKDDESRKRAVKTKIGERRTLIVLDDVQNVEMALEFKMLGPNCVYIMTTRRRDVAESLLRQKLVMVLQELDEFAGPDVLKRLAPMAVDFDPAAAEVVTGLLEKVPLALGLAGMYLKKMSSQENPDKIRASFREVRQAAELCNLRLASGESEKAAIAEIIDLNCAALESDAIRRTFLALSVFSPKPNAFSKEIANHVCGADVDTIYDLCDLGLIEYYGGRNYTMHRVISEYAKDKLQTIDPGVFEKLHAKALDYYAQRLGTHIDNAPNAYRDNYRLERVDWQSMEDAWFHHLTHTTDVTRSLLAFLRVYFDIFWWWGYFQRFPFCNALIRQWQQCEIAPRVREGLDLLIAFQEAFPAGYDRQATGNWPQVEAALTGIRKLIKLDADETPKMGEDQRRVRAFTEFFLAEAYAYGRGDRQGALNHYNAAYNLFLPDGNKWEGGWICFYAGQFLLENGDYDAAREYVTRSLNAGDESIPLGERDSELLANCYRLLGDLSLAEEDFATASRHYQQAVFYAYAFQGIPTVADSYTMAFYWDVTSRIAGKAANLYRDNPQEGAKLCDEAHAFWKPYWSLSAVESPDLKTLLKSGNAERLMPYMFPPGLADYEIKEGAASYQKHVISVIESLQETCKG